MSVGGMGRDECSKDGKEQSGGTPHIRERCTISDLPRWIWFILAGAGADERRGAAIYRECAENRGDSGDAPGAGCALYGSCEVMRDREVGLQNQPRRMALRF